MSKNGNEQPTQKAPVPLRQRDRNPITSQRSGKAISETTFPARDVLDLEIDAAIQEKRRADPARAFPPPALNPIPSDPKSDAHEMGPLSYIMDKQEFRFRVMHRLLQRHVQLSSIATVLGVSTKTAQRLSDEIRAKYRAEVSGFNTSEFVGQTMWDYNDLLATVRAMWSEAKTFNERVTVVRLTNEMISSRVRFANVAGLLVLENMLAEQREEVDGSLLILSRIMRKAMDERVEPADLE